MDNDAGGIATYSLAGAGFGMTMLWTLVPIAILLIVIQEMVARMAVVSGKGLSDLIRERYGVKCAFYMMIVLILNNLGNTLAEFAGIAAALEIFGISRYISVPVSILFLLWLVVKGTYGSVEKVFLTACLFYVAYVVAGFLVKPDWQAVAASLTSPTIRLETDFVVMLVGLVGTTIAPVDDVSIFRPPSWIRGFRSRISRLVRIDVIAGSVVVNIVGVLYHPYVRCNAVQVRDHHHQRRGSGHGPSARCREILHVALRIRFAQRVVVCCIHSAAIHRVHGVRGLRLGIEPRPEILGSSSILYSLLFHCPVFRARDSRTQSASGNDHVHFPGLERHCPPCGAHIYDFAE